ncbi:ATP-dependent helicase HrpB [Vibrio sp. SCSIO 43135]|uniref:ATP-dependent helicase HrpB n=1 Tax=Vibrio sp. SCSIO 43135 TaxID=2819096 RepID=UPI00256EE175|nr:ATP-dependent helicase HrpB [Vibrio sp. SCSIO 43135]
MTSQQSILSDSQDALPIQSVISQLLSSVQNSNQVILKAAPGAGKSTYFPLQLVKNQCVAGKIIMLEPRRLAARNIAQYLAAQLGEKVGERVGYRVRGDTKAGPNTQLEIVTEGIMTRMIQDDPELTGVDLLIFDEFHERSIHADTALALSLEIQAALREELKLVVMSATLDNEALQALLPDAKYIESHGRAFAVAQRYQPLKPNEYLPQAMANQIEFLMANEPGSLLAFLPGVAAIKQVEEKLSHLKNQYEICPLYGQLNFSQQQKAIAPAEPGQRKVVLATNIAETSLTIEGIRIVVDSGLERVARFDLKTGVTKLEQVKIAQSSAEQRAGRAGRLEEGICVRLYSESSLLQQPKVPEAEILHSDLSSLAMELAQWGTRDPAELSWLDTPAKASMSQAKQLLKRLSLMDENDQLTSLGQQAHTLGVEPRLASMLTISAQMSEQDTGLVSNALLVAALSEEPERQVSDLLQSVHRFNVGKHSKQSVIAQRIKNLSSKLAVKFQNASICDDSISVVAALAFPDRIAQLRSNSGGQYLLANGHGAQLRDEDALFGNDYLITIDLLRSGQQSSFIQLASPIDIHYVKDKLPKLFKQTECVDWDESRGRLVAEHQLRIGRLVIERKELPEPSPEKMTQALLSYVRRKGLSVLNWSVSSQELLQRIRCAIDWLPEQEWPAMDDQSLLDELELWIEPYMQGVNSAKALKNISLEQALLARLGWPLNQDIDKWLPTHHVVPTGSKKKICYQQGSEPMLSVRMQEMFGEQESPAVALGKVKLVVELLSPAQRPLQVTKDLAGFWQGAYREVQKEMKGRYPKHVWPDDPANHVATTKTKRQLDK